MCNIHRQFEIQMKLEQQSHATLKSTLQDHKTIGAHFKSERVLLSSGLQQWEQLKPLCFPDEMAAPWEPTAAPNELL